MDHLFFEALTEREKDVLRLRCSIISPPIKDDGSGYAFLGGGAPPLSLASVGKALGISRQRVKQLEDKALKKLRSPKMQRKVRIFVSCVSEVYLCEKQTNSERRWLENIYEGPGDDVFEFKFP